ncbi:hypothetical protein OV320_0863 [Actinobacteria bacterium OV320]|nr:hypothetical protein OV320_0863 [Actinobacteria bacterium OV320]
MATCRQVPVNVLADGGPDVLRCAVVRRRPARAAPRSARNPDLQAIRSTRPGGHVGYIGVSHDVTLDGQELFFSHVHPHGGPAPVRQYLPQLIDLIWTRQIDPGKVFDLTLPPSTVVCYLSTRDMWCAL